MEMVDVIQTLTCAAVVYAVWMLHRRVTLLENQWDRINELVRKNLTSHYVTEDMRLHLEQQAKDMRPMK